MEEDKYRTVKATAEGLYKEKGSRFIAFIYPVMTEEEIKEILAEKKLNIMMLAIIVMPIA